MISICAVIAARNEFPYLRVLLPMLANQGIDVAIVDNGSTDASIDLYSSYIRNPIILVEHLRYKGIFSLTEQLEAKKDICNKIKHDWVIHHDADEVFEHFKPGLTLRDAIKEADENGYTALNFDEFVFLPEPESDYSNRNYYKEILNYYFFEPGKNRKNACWKRTAGLTNVMAGGHRLSGKDLSIFPINHIFRHYILLSYEHAKRKYLNRTFSKQDLDRGWHGNRLNFTVKNLELPHASKFLFQLPKYDSKEFSRALPTAKHYWEWGLE